MVPILKPGVQHSDSKGVEDSTKARGGGAHTLELQGHRVLWTGGGPRKEHTCIPCAGDSVQRAENARTFSKHSNSQLNSIYPRPDHATPLSPGVLIIQWALQ